ncbi:MAG: hypothetical protein EA001_07620 [Oscillatoriales cyanobacterium]|nr:MAG: hypothetical protein EA001_07620 [Oscillatoriales cyanobacterium]
MKKYFFLSALFGSAFLLFWVQFIIAKSLLPFLGGTPAVWNVCQSFFQVALLIGYAYAAWLGDRPKLRQQLLIHLAAIGAGCAIALARFPQLLAQLPMGSDRPIATLLLVLGSTILIPFCVLSATAPLLQRWVSQTRLSFSQNPYVLYAASNAGSLLGVLSYPSAIEPAFSLLGQRQAWLIAYVLEAIMIVACAAIVWRDRSYISTADQPVVQSNLSQSGEEFSGEKPSEITGDLPSASSTKQIGIEQIGESSPFTNDVDNADNADTHASIAPHWSVAIEQPTWRDRLQWALFAFLPASLSLGVTTYITTDLAAVPLFWAIPLSLYLLTYIVAFSNWRRAGQIYPWAVALLPVLVTPLVFWSRLDGAQNLWVMLPFHWVGFTLAAFICHQTLALIKPTVEHLTRFYWWLAIGGAAGGFFNAIIAPYLFPNTQEYPLVLILTLAATIGLGQLPKWSWIAVGLGLGVLLAGVNGKHFGDYWAAYLVAFSLLGTIAYALQLRKTKIITATFAIILMMQFSVGLRGEVVLTDRSFFGVNRVVIDRSRQVISLLHGTTLHGQQSLLPQRRDRPLTYFTETGPIGEFFEGFNQTPRDRVAVLGLGVGTLAAYAQPNQQWTFYEIDPDVKQIATNPQYFDFLSNAKGKVAVEIGDGRLKMQTLPDRSLDLAIMDAFSSDSIPVHLITREAIALYTQKLKPNGLILINITNRYLDLLPVVGATAQDLNLVAIHRWDVNVSEAERVIGKTPSHWVAIGRNQRDLAWLTSPIKSASTWQAVDSQPPNQLWTDNRSSLLSVMRSR